MNNNLAIHISGNQQFMNREIPVVLGGFGPDAKCVSDKTIAEIHSQPEREIRRRITDNIKRFRENVDYIDLPQRVGESHTLELLNNLGYSKRAITQAEHIYILSERGYAKLIKIMDTDLAWEIHDKLIDEYFELREHRPSTDLSTLSPELRLLIGIELKQKEQDKALDDTNARIDSISEIVALNPNSWRADARNLIVRIAHKIGGNEFIRDVQSEIFKLVDERAGVSLETRPTNKRRRMADEGVCKSKRDKLNKTDVISEDKKLIEIYVAIVKEMAVKHGAAGAVS